MHKQYIFILGVLTILVAGPVAAKAKAAEPQPYFLPLPGEGVGGAVSTPASSVKPPAAKSEVVVATPKPAKLTSPSATRPSPPPDKSTPAKTTFAFMAEDEPLAKIWNDRDFQKSLLGSYGFQPDIEPRFDPEEQKYYQDVIVPLLTKNQKRAIWELEWKAKPAASAQFDFILGNLCFQNDDFTKAAKYFAQATTKFPSFRRAWKNLGMVRVRLGDYEMAIAPLARAIALGDNESRTYAILAFAYMNAGRYTSAESAYRYATISEPDNLEYKLGIVKCQVAQGNYDAAAAMLDELLQRYPEKDTLWSIQANIYLQKNLPGKAAVNFEMLRRLGKATPENLTVLGDIYMTQEYPGLALPVYQEAIQLDGWKHPAHALRAAEILTSRGAWKEAAHLFAKIRETAAGNLTGADEVKLLKYEAKLALATGKGEEAIKVIEQIIVRNPLDGEALLMAGDYYARNGDPDTAHFRYETASKVSGYEADAYVKEAQLLVKSSKYSQAAELLRKAQKVKSRDNVQRYLEKVEQLALSSRS